MQMETNSTTDNTIVEKRIDSETACDEEQYLQLIANILRTGTRENTRNGDTLSLFGASMRFSLLREGQAIIPLMTTKRLAWKTCLKELLWFVRGETDNKLLQQQNVHIWNANGSREFLDSRGLYQNRENDLGPVYGHQWRHFNAPYENCDVDYSSASDKGVDQLQRIIEILTHDDEQVKKQNMRRLVMSAWNPCQLDQMALPPCHILVQFHVTDDKYLSCALYQRSGDVGLGVPFNIASYAFLTHLIAHHCGLVAKEFVHFIGDAHIYVEHCDALQEQMKRMPYQSPSIHISNKYDNINDYQFKDFQITDYQHHDTIKMEMKA